MRLTDREIYVLSYAVSHAAAEYRDEANASSTLRNQFAAQAAEADTLLAKIRDACGIELLASPRANPARLTYTKQDRDNLDDLISNTREFILGEGEELSDRVMVLKELIETAQCNSDIYQAGQLREQMIQDALISICGAEEHQ